MKQGRVASARAAGPLSGRVAAVAAAAAATALPLRETAPAAPRRMPRPRPAPVPRPARGARADLPLGARLVGWVRALPDHRMLDRLIGGRLWIVLIGTLLVGLVTLQLSLLKLNAGIGEAVQKSAQLEEGNRALRIANSQLEDSERVIAAATQMGLVMPPQGSPRFLRSSGSDAANALRTMRAPDPAAAAAAAAAAGATGAAAGGDAATTDGTTADATTTDGTTADGATADATTTDGTTADGAATSDGTTAAGVAATDQTDAGTADTGATTGAGTADTTGTGTATGTDTGTATGTGATGTDTGTGAADSTDAAAGGATIG